MLYNHQILQTQFKNVTYNHNFGTKIINLNITYYEQANLKKGLYQRLRQNETKLQTINLDMDTGKTLKDCLVRILDRNVWENM